MLLELLLVVLIGALPVILPVFGYSSRWFWLGYAGFLLCLAAYGVMTISRKRTLKRSEDDTFLKKQYRAIEREMTQRGKVPALRFSVWVLRRNFSLRWGLKRWMRQCLQIAHADNYDEQVAAFWRLTIGVGLVGRTFQRGKPTVAQLAKCSLNELIGEGLSSIEARMVKAEAIVEAIAIPIKDVSRGGRILGVLKIESSASLQNNLFRNEKFHGFLNEIVEAIAPLLR